MASEAALGELMQQFMATGDPRARQQLERLSSEQHRVARAKPVPAGRGIVFEGLVADGVMCGQGRLLQLGGTGRGAGAAAGTLTEASFIGGAVAEGRGVVISPTGARREGSFTDGELQGAGLEVDARCVRGAGAWRGGAKHGPWVYTAPDGVVATTSYIGGTRVGAHRLVGVVPRAVAAAAFGKDYYNNITNARTALTASSTSAHATAAANEPMTGAGARTNTVFGGSASGSGPSSSLSAGTAARSPATRFSGPSAAARVMCMVMREHALDATPVPTLDGPAGASFAPLVFSDEVRVEARARARARRVARAVCRAVWAAAADCGVPGAVAALDETLWGWVDTQYPHLGRPKQSQTQTQMQQQPLVFETTKLSKAQAEAEAQAAAAKDRATAAAKDDEDAAKLGVALRKMLCMF